MEIRSDSITIWNTQGLWLDLTWEDVFNLKQELDKIDICWICKLPIDIVAEGANIHSGCYQYLLKQANENLL